MSSGDLEKAGEELLPAAAADLDLPAPAPSGEYRVPSARQVEANIGMYETAYTEARRSLDAQLTELNNLRTRVVQFLAFVGTATAFLVGTGIKSLDRHAGFYVVAIAATVFAAIMLALAIAVLNPWSSSMYNDVEIKDMLKDLIEREVPVAGRGDMLREMALQFDEWRLANEKVLDKIRVEYLVAIGAGALQLGLWSTLVWTTA